MRIYRKILFVSIVLATFLSAAANNASAAAYAIYFSAPAEVPPGAEFPVRILVDSEQPINAYDININYAGLDLAGFNDSHSLIDVWQDRPLLYGGSSIKWRGGSLTPFSGTGGELMTINFRAAATGAAELSFGNAAFYLANGKGTKVTPQTKSFSLTVTSQSASSSAVGFVEAPSVPDETPPAVKFLSIIPDPINKEQKLVGFLVSDSDSGIKSVSLKTRSYFFWSDWQNAQNPTAIPLSVWAADFKAADNAGNVIEKIIYDWPAFWRFVFMIAAAAAVIIALLVLLMKKGRKENEKVENSN